MEKKMIVNGKWDVIVWSVHKHQDDVPFSLDSEE